MTSPNPHILTFHNPIKRTDKTSHQRIILFQPEIHHIMEVK